MPRGITPEQALNNSISSGQKISKLKQLRSTKGLSQNDLANLSDVNIRSIQSYESFDNKIESASLKTLCSICEALECGITDVLDDEELIQRINNLSNITPSKNNTSHKETYESNLIKKYFFYLESDSLTEDQKLGISYITSDFPDEWKSILVLRFINEYTLNEIAKSKGITAERVRQLIEKALKKLEEFEKSEIVIYGYNAYNEALTKKDFNTPPLERSIDELHLSGRAYNALMRAGLTTIKMVINEKDNLRQYSGMGDNIIKEIVEKIANY